MSQEQSCALRALTLCDGHTSLRPPPSARPCGCYCQAITELVDQDQLEEASWLRTDRARAVAQSAILERIARFRQSW